MRALLVVTLVGGCELAIPATEVELPRPQVAPRIDPMPSRVDAAAVTIRDAGTPTGFRVVRRSCYASAAAACAEIGCPTSCTEIGGAELTPILGCGGSGVPTLTTVLNGDILCIRAVDPVVHATREAVCLAAACPVSVHDYCGDDGDRLVSCRNGGW
jgi:hypothetical protein